MICKVFSINIGGFGARPRRTHRHELSDASRLDAQSEVRFADLDATRPTGTDPAT